MFPEEWRKSKAVDPIYSLHYATSESKTNGQNGQYDRSACSKRTYVGWAEAKRQLSFGTIEDDYNLIASLCGMEPTNKLYASNIPFPNTEEPMTSGDAVRGGTGRYLTEDVQLEVGLSCMSQ